MKNKPKKENKTHKRKEHIHDLDGMWNLTMNPTITESFAAIPFQGGKRDIVVSIIIIIMIAVWLDILEE
jgi:hypothetical protein